MSRVVLFNKPFNVLSQYSTEGIERQTLKDYFPSDHLYPAGRLDFDSEGLLVLTDDGHLQHIISHPKFKQAKTYWAQVDGEITEVALNQLRSGVTLNDGPTLPALAARIEEPANLWARHPPIRYRANIPTSWLSLTITEGRNRQVRRMTAAVGFPTLRLIRAAIGDWQLDCLQPGEYRELTAGEVQQLIAQYPRRPASAAARPYRSASARPNGRRPRR